MGKQVDIIIPTRNEEDNIAKVLKEVWQSLPDCNIVVVDDSDNDVTKLIASLDGAQIIQGQHKGLGQAIVDGINKSKADIIVVMDADLSHPPSKIKELVEACSDGYDMAVGSRYVKGGSIKGWTYKRRIISLVASMLAYPVSRISDNTSGFFAISRDALDGVELCADSWKIMLETLVKTNAKVKEVPIEFKDRESGVSKFNKKEVYAYIKHLIKLAMYKYPVINFMIVGGIGYFINMAVYYPLTLWFQKTTTFLGQEFYLPPFIVSSFVAITSNYLLNKRYTFGEYQEKKLGYIKYLTTCSASLPIEMVLIFLLVRFMGFIPTVAVAVSILLVFIGRYAVLRRIVWHKKQRNIC